MDIGRKNIQEYKINSYSDVGLCRRKGVSFAKKLGFDDVQAGEIAIIITEMVTNVIKHGGGKGHFMICEISNTHNKSGMEIWCCDFGKGIADIPEAFLDGYTEKKSLGVGLGAIRRLSDELDANPENDGDFPPNLRVKENKYGYCIRSRKWKPGRKWTAKNKHIQTGAVSRPKPGETLNGDTYVFLNIDANRSVGAVIDGLGHGKEAHIASSLAREQILKKPELAPDALLISIHESIKGTRGITIGLVKIDTEINKLFFTGIGNIEGNLISGSNKKNLLSFGGIVGHSIRTPRVFDFDFNKGDIVYMYSDGITSRWGYEEIDLNENPQKNAEFIFNKYARQNDDATILIIRYIA